MYFLAVPMRVFHIVGGRRRQRPGELTNVDKTFGLHQPMRHVDSEAVDAEVEPEPQRLFEVGSDVGVLPVQIRLLRRVQVQVPLPRSTLRVDDARPGRATELANPVVGWLIAVVTTAVAE